MVKVITFLKRKIGMPVEEFQTYWRTGHPEVVTRLPGIRRYVQSHTLLSAYGTGEPVYDGIAEVWADDTAALRAMTRSPAHPAVQADEARFIDRSSMGVIITEDHVIKDGPVPPDAVKRVEFLTRKTGLPVEEFQRHWLLVQGPIVAADPSLRRYIQSHTRRSAYEAGRVPAYDGAALTWYDSDEASHAGARSILTREHIIVP